MNIMSSESDEVSVNRRRSSTRRQHRFRIGSSSNDVTGASEDEAQPVRLRVRGKYMKYSSDQKNMFIRLYEEGQSIKDAASLAGLTWGTGKFLVMKYKRNGSELTEQGRGGPRGKKLNQNVLDAIESLVEENPGITLKEMKSILASRNIILSKSTIDNGLRLLKITLKIASKEVDRMNSPESIRRRREYALRFNEWAPTERGNLVFIDESGFNLHLRRTQARSRKNSRAVVTVPTIRGRNTTLIMAMNNQAVIHFKVIPIGNCNAIRFNEFLTELSSKLQHHRDTYLVMDLK
uniref:3-isopropylmalate dehydratase small subunit n=1 Tax=Lygus hesperus TaxID=30085 RepID=A0A0A9WCV6_LYGHE